MEGMAMRTREVGRMARLGIVAALLAALCAVVAPGAALAAGTITGIVPSSGPAAGGTSVAITGTGLASATAVSFGSTPATITANTDTQITVTAPPGALGAVDVVITFADTTTLTAGSFTYVAAPAVSSVSPAMGPTAGNGPVTIAGTGFQPGATVTFGGAATTVLSVSDTAISATPPDHAAGSVDVVVTNPDAQSGTLANGFTYVAAPTVTSLDTLSGPAGGGTTVTITGTNLTGTTAVTFGGATATGLSITSDTTITVSTPPHAAGLVDVAVTAPGGTATAAGAFTYIAAPTIVRITPSSTEASDDDPTDDDPTAVVITGTGFQPGATVTFGGIAATGVVVINATTIGTIAPPHAAGAVDVVLTNPDGQSATAQGGFTYVGPPAVTGISPASGPAAGGTVVTITGDGFQPGARVFFDGAAATNVTVASTTSITATTPATNHGRTVNVAVQNPGGERGTLHKAFTYTDSAGHGPPASGALAVTRVEPPSGPTTGDADIVIKGTGFTAGMAVMIGGAPATDVHVLNGTTIRATTPAHATEGPVDVTVSGNGQSATLAGAYTYGKHHESPGPDRRGGGGSPGGQSPGHGPEGRHGPDPSQPSVTGSPTPTAKPAVAPTHR